MSNGSCQPHKVGVLVGPETNPFEMGVATEVFGLDRPELGGRPYHLTICGPGRVTMRQGFFALTPTAPLQHLAEMETVIVPGYPYPTKAATSEVVGILNDAYSNGARIVSFCSGSLVLAEAGLLDGRKATTHWHFSAELVRRFPQVDVQVDVLYVDSHPIYTAAGSAAALDLALHLVRLDLGEEAANIVARRLVFPAYRLGDQRQFVNPPAPPTFDAPSLDRLQHFAEEHLHTSLTMPQLAIVVNMSVTSFYRWFKALVGSTPQQWIIQLRVARARQLLESSDASIEQIARFSGFGTATTMRRHFKKTLGVPPSRYRETFTHEAVTAEATHPI